MRLVAYDKYTSTLPKSQSGRGASSSLTLHFDAVILEAQIQSKTINNGTDLGLKKRGILQFIEPERI